MIESWKAEATAPIRKVIEKVLAEAHMVSGTLRVLVVEDEYLAAIEVMDTLSSMGAEVFGPFPRVASALVAARGNHVDLALVDLRLGDEWAFRLIDELKSRGASILLITGVEPQQLPRRYRLLPLLKKPFRFRSLQERLIKIVASDELELPRRLDTRR